MHWCVIRRRNCSHSTKPDEASLSMNCWSGNQVSLIAKAFAYEKLLYTGLALTFSASFHRFAHSCRSYVVQKTPLALEYRLSGSLQRTHFGERETTGGTVSSAVKSGAKWTDTCS